MSKQENNYKVTLKVWIVIIMIKHLKLNQISVLDSL